MLYFLKFAGYLALISQIYKCESNVYYQKNNISIPRQYNNDRYRTTREIEISFYTTFTRYMIWWSKVFTILMTRIFKITFSKSLMKSNIQPIYTYREQGFIM
ncbi:hypothetical protein ACTFIV_007120 [Dictyostelium citrinum]